MNQSTTTRVLGDLIPRSMVALVDLDGFAVPVGEKDIPEVRPEAAPADSWPRWTDLMVLADGPDRTGLDVYSGLERLQEAFHDHLDRLEDGVEALPPLSGGSDEAEPFEPSAEDIADFHAWSEDLDRRRAAADRHSPDALARIHLALYGRSEPFHA